jgi:protein arginine kinase activator
MLCQICKQREATIHFTNVVGSEVEKIHLCSGCAEEKGFDYLKKSNFTMGELLVGLVDSAGRKGKQRAGADVCPNCGHSYSEFKKAVRLGCAQCYEHFEAQLLPVLRSVHGNTRHIGKVPKRFRASVSRRRRVVELEDELARAIELEQYERAAELRDEIKGLKQSNEGGAG